MSKKNQPIGVAIDEVQQGELTVLQVSIKDDVIGVIKPLDKTFEVDIEGDQPVKVKTQDDGIEYLIQAYNLHH
ncbi:hypothetical protein AYR62_03875 [Secundilactobacillus paracollinoides]|uniref:DUF2969 domain-containing protein n=1 Tax=Secundilactobacillus paracollinoides TaxID=240427 RepID=A0A1B2IZX9_9LACO|nr:DUF2969 domain-containing protein [Secundilactobacillus paracollinoides]ANZ61687.1 hypothetical protein AYR61_10165 [Secundilactobacillus paracollinoides]ANZ63324.1 hypothetical protein AYR62_03875 [Secundilactobacillus paracollinoides]ANZ67605.1 hypothetical protein AYR63_10910 [Secundilactobacillus paracollinoides]KRL75999.1 hypothetical protein FC17_GL002312 [Secundilactobacillus paracollinoides DSM 15502 = JCM 11969]